MIVNGNANAKTGKKETQRCKGARMQGKKKAEEEGNAKVQRRKDAKKTGESKPRTALFHPAFLPASYLQS
jgi:hypothetical protein